MMTPAVVILGAVLNVGHAAVGPLFRMGRPANGQAAQAYPRLGARSPIGWPFRRQHRPPVPARVKPILSQAKKARQIFSQAKKSKPILSQAKTEQQSKVSPPPSPGDLLKINLAAARIAYFAYIRYITYFAYLTYITYITKYPDLPPPTPKSVVDMLKVRRMHDLKRTFEKVVVPSGSANFALEPDSNAIPGTLDNGFTYVILPNPSPTKRFEAHLEIMSGSANEEDRQQGIAHLVEHMTFLGSEKRNPLLGTGSKSNAFTDFHHTVFHVDCPLHMPGTNNSPMLPRALDLFKDILEARSQGQFGIPRLVKERSAVLSEMQMMNTVEYRVDCHILESLHAENRLSARFPIGKEDLIKDWDLDEVIRFHRTHYRPTNVMLYVVGDLDTQTAEQLIRSSFDSLPSDHEDYDRVVESASAAQKDAAVKVEWGKGAVGDYLPQDVVGPLGEKIEPSLKLQSMHFPPVLHKWNGGEYDKSHAVPVSPVDLAFSVGGAVAKTNPDALNKRVGSSLKTMQTANPAVNVNDPAVVTTLVSDALSNSIADAAKKIREPMPEFNPEAPYNVGLFHHSALKAFSFHIYIKQPIQPINDVQAMRQIMARNLAIFALKVRLSMKTRTQSGIPITYMEFEMADAPREGANVGSIDLSCEGKHWREAIAVAIMEVRRFGLYGITEGEFLRYKKALLENSAQAAALEAQGAIPHGEWMERLKESVACHHTWMSAQKAQEACEQVMDQITKEECDNFARDLTEHIVHFGKLQGEPLPAAIVAEVPPPLELNNSMVVEAIKDAASRHVDPEPEVVVPATLMYPEKVAELTAKNPPAWADDGPVKDETTSAIARKLSNGIKVSYMHLPHDPQRGFMRIMAPGGRICERGPGGKGASMGAAIIGALTLQEGGYFDPWTRQQIELFMVNNMINGEMQCHEDALVIDLSFSTVKVSDSTVSGLEALLQFVNQILVPGKFTWQKYAFERAKDALAQQHESLMSSLEGAAIDKLMRHASNHDKRFNTLNREELDKVTFEEAKETTLLQLNPSFLDVAIVGDIDLQETEKLLLQYLGTVPKSDAKRKEAGKALFMNEARAPAPAPAPPMPCPERQLRVHIEDPYPRAAAYMSGPAPNHWGILSDGRHIRDAVAELAPDGNYSSVADRAAYVARRMEFGPEALSTGEDEEVILDLGEFSEKKDDRWAHPLFSPVALAVLQEVINTKLFTVVRDRKQLTYDTTFRFTGYQRMDGAYWQTYVTASPGKVDLALEACQQALEDILDPGIKSWDTPAAKRTVVKQHEAEVLNNGYWASLLAGSQSDAWPLKNLGDLKDFHRLVEAVTPGDLTAIMKVIGLGDQNQCYTCIGMSGTTQGSEQVEETGHTLPGTGSSRAKLR